MKYLCIIIIIIATIPPPSAIWTSCVLKQTNTHARTQNRQKLANIATVYINTLLIWGIDSRKFQVKWTAQSQPNCEQKAGVGKTWITKHLIIMILIYCSIQITKSTQTTLQRCLKQTQWYKGPPKKIRFQESLECIGCQSRREFVPQFGCIS
jgi:hypothetical protein